MNPLIRRSFLYIGYLRLLAIQLLVVLVTALILWQVVDLVHAYSAFLGGMICVIPSAVFAFFVFRHRGAQAAKKIVTALYVGEALKYALTLALFAAVFICVAPIAALPFFMTFIIVQLLHWLAPLVMKR